MRWNGKVELLMLLALTIGALNLPAIAADWKVEANQRIEELRKRDVALLIVDANGDPVPSVPVSVKQTKQSFPFGAAITGQFLKNEQAQKFFKAHFNWAVFGNESKWYANERVKGQVDYSTADALTDWCEANDIPVRGHCIFWEPAKWQMRWLKESTKDEARAAVERRLESVVSHFKGRFVHWDVDNETLHGSFYKDLFGEEIWPWMFKRARELDPEAKLFVNEFNVLSVDKDFTEVETDAYVEHVRWLLDQGAPIDGVGIQGHIWADNILEHPEVVKERLDKVATLGLPIWISEFDTADPDPGVNADRLELVYRMAYSHPSVEGIMMWVYWSENSWRGPNGGIASRDWTLNPAGERYEALMTEWSTQSEGVSDAEGWLRFRGFSGTYEARVMVAGNEVAQTFQVEAGKGLEEVVLKLK